MDQKSISVKRIAAQSKIISCGILNTSESAFVGLGRLDFTRLLTSFRYGRLVDTLEDLLPMLERVDITEKDASEIPNLLGLIVERIDIVLAADAAPFNFYRKEERTRRLMQLRDKISTVKEKVDLILECKAFYDIDQEVAEDWEYANSEV